MQKYSFFALTMLLAGCGGGGGGGDNPTPNQVKDSSDFPAEQIRVNVSFNALGDGTAKVNAYVHTSTGESFIPLGAGDSVLLTANDETQSLKLTKDEIIEGSGSFGGEYYSLVSRDNYPEYTLTFVREQGSYSNAFTFSQNDIPTPFVLQETLSNEVIDLRWSPEADHSYTLLGPTFFCYSGNTVEVKGGHPSEGDLNGVYNKSLSEIFNLNQSQLVAGKSGCYIEAEVLGFKVNLNNASENILVDVSQRRNIRFDLN
ncbi:hypothetical protein RN22_10140 [Grimontia sp. AD028]|uniref:hypothetical protein n=1 Tax=Grimontia sp. AD028 TaxID=1581149 RepID=UPI00061B3603|nr:hypothetical protein [Grimontia sp. AD028]KKD60536.1 hypothetical protein RN22_10140 [Grimontia sp. AD028]